jgi:choline dehydrogenase-like flavoprotein
MGICLFERQKEGLMVSLTNLKSTITRTIDASTASGKIYDAVIVGSGISGCILAKELTKENLNVLIVEAGLGHDLSQDGYQHYLETFYSAVSKDNNAPYPRNPNAEMPRSPDIKPLRPNQPNTDGYWVQYGPFVSDSVYTRVLGGTTMHWEGKTIRMLRDDFQMYTKFAQGLDWPIDFETLEPYYRKAEFEIGVSGDARGQERLGVQFEKDYVYPMKEMPPSYLDQVVAEDLEGMTVSLDGKNYPLWLATFPQGRNGIPHEDYGPWNPVSKGKLYNPVGAVSLHQADEGERCQGNTNCVPLCPVQAKYDARKTLAVALNTGKVDLLPQAVASQVHFDPGSGAVKEIDVKVYDNPQSSAYKTYKVRGQVFILAANAVENARLMLSSVISGENTRHRNDYIGRYLMDHPFLLTWGLMRKNGGVGRGPLVTSGICNLRNGDFRRKQAAFAVDIHNDGWGWATGSPVSDLTNVVDNLNKYGADLRQELVSRISRQVLLATMIEMPPDRDNRVTVDTAFTDPLGNLRPIVSYRIPEYSLAAVEYARNLSRLIFQRLGAEDFTYYDPLDYGYVTYNRQGYALRGGNHLSGTHIMGLEGKSVVDSYQKSWDHPNLYLIGPGSMPTIGSSNTTLTVAALCLRTAEVMLKDLKSPITIRN